MSAATLKTREFQAASRHTDAEYFSKFFVLRISKNRNDTGLTYGIVISKKIAKSCLRNKIKRRLRCIINSYTKVNDASFTIIIYTRKPILRCNYQELEQQFHHQINRFKNNSNERK